MNSFQINIEYDVRPSVLFLSHSEERMSRIRRKNEDFERSRTEEKNQENEVRSL